MLSVKQGASSTIFWVFGLTWPGIEPLSSRPLVNILSIKWIGLQVNLFPEYFLKLFFPIIYIYIYIYISAKMTISYAMIRSKVHSTLRLYMCIYIGNGSCSYAQPQHAYKYMLCLYSYNLIQKWSHLYSYISFAHNWLYLGAEEFIVSQWHNGYRCRRLIRWPEFKTWTKLYALMLLRIATPLPVKATD